MSDKALRQRGISLIELIIAMTIMGIAIAAVMAVFMVTTRTSADPMAQEQALFIARAHMDEILVKAFYDPDSLNVCPTAESSRDAYDNVCDYNGMSKSPPENQLGAATVTGYTVTVTVEHSGISLHSGGNLVDNSSGIKVLLVTVTVTGPGNAQATLQAYRTNYQCNTSGDTECKPAT
jgi:MSHA pilin protein MshD